MVTKMGGVKLVDFDWCGEHKLGRYPVSMNDNRDLKNGGIDWHLEVERGGRMMKEHDTYRLSCMKSK